MHRLIAVVTVLLVLLHGVFGCCGQGLVGWDVAVACPCEHAHFGASAASPTNCDAAGHELPAQPPHECDHAAYHWLASVAAPRVGDQQGFGTAPLMMLRPAAASLANTAELSLDHPPVQFSAPPLRLHLALGVLLI